MVDLTGLNPQQGVCVTHSLKQGQATAVLAGAGSGKTRVLTTRTAYLVDDLQVHPGRIMSVTFTNKAANEMKHRIESLGVNLTGMWIGTFHSICVRLLRKFGTNIGLKNFSIMDSSDQLKLIRKLIRESGVKYEDWKAMAYLKKISTFKNDFKNPSQVMQNATDAEDIIVARIYEEYQNRNWRNGMLDFDDLIIYAVILLRKTPSVKTWLHQNLNYIQVDEYQDTNTTQFYLLQELKGPDTNLFVVGDDWQSIYKFRNAKPKYMIQFESFFKNSQILKLEQNYRSSGVIVEASNALIRKNTDRTDKSMFTSKPDGRKIMIHAADDGREEAKWIAQQIYMNKATDPSFNYKDVAILYRTKMLSRNIEQSLAALGIPNKIIAGLSFYDRKEIKDTLTYLRVYANPSDHLSFGRMLKLYPGVGDKRVDDVIKFATDNGLNLSQVLNHNIPGGQALQLALTSCRNILNQITFVANDPVDALNEVVKLSPVANNLLADGSEEALERLDNITELQANAQQFIDDSMGISDDVIGFLESIALTTTVEDNNEGDHVSLMTLHASKGLEYPMVFVVGCEEGLLPHKNALKDDELIEEERRLGYVGMTRAESMLIMTRAVNRRLGNNTNRNRESRFLREIPDKYVEEV